MVLIRPRPTTTYATPRLHLCVIILVKVSAVFKAPGKMGCTYSQRDHWVPCSSTGFLELKSSERSSQFHLGGGGAYNTMEMFSSIAFDYTGYLNDPTYVKAKWDMWWHVLVYGWC